MKYMNIFSLLFIAYNLNCSYSIVSQLFFFMDCTDNVKYSCNQNERYLEF